MTLADVSQSPSAALTIAGPPAQGYWLAAADGGGAFVFGELAYLGGMAGWRLNAPVVGIAATPSGKGYWPAADAPPGTCGR